MKTVRAGLCALVVAAFAPAPALADTLIDNVEGFTLDRDGNVERLNGLLIGDDGRIVQVLHRGDKRPGKVDYLLDGKGRVLMPGLIDAHVHVMELGFGALTLDLSAARSLAEAQGRIAAYAAAHTDRPWIIGRGWNEARWGLGRALSAADLDAAVADRPVWLLRSDGRAGWANSAALRAAGLAAMPKNVPTSKGARVPVPARPAGVLVDAAMAPVARVMPVPRPEDRDLALAQAQVLLLQRGVTAVADMGTTIEDWQTFRRAGDLGALRIRIMAYAAGSDAMSLIGGPGPTPWLYDDRLRLNGVKLAVDEAMPEGTRLRNLMSRGAIDRFQVAVDAIGAPANTAVLDAIGELSETYKGDRRWRIEQAQMVTPGDIARFARFGVIASMQPVQATAAPGGAWPWASLAKAGARLAFGSDAPHAMPDPFAGIAAAMTRQDPLGQPSGGWQPQESVTREAALAGYTTGPAYAGFAEGRFGRLAAGLRADFLIVDRDPLLASSNELRATRVLEAWVGGHIMWTASAPPAEEGR